MAKKRNILAVILGGGAGTRLFPLTQQRSKPAVPLGGKYRLVDVPISNCINSDILQIFVLTQYNSASLNRHIARTYRFSQFSQGFVEILAAEQTLESPHWFQGTADAVRQVLPHIRDWDIDTLLILSGDHLYRMDYRKFLARHDEAGADVTVSVIPRERQAAEEFGLLKVDQTGRITEFREKPKGASLEEMLGMNDKWVDFGREVIPAAIDCCHVQSYLFDGYWEDIGTIAAFHSANLDMCSPLPQFNFFDADSPIYTRTRYLPPSKLHNCEIANSLVSEGCIINQARIARSVVGVRSRIEQGARIEDTYLMGADYFQSVDDMREDVRRGVPRIGVGEGAVIRNAIIDKNTRIGAGVRLLNEAGVEHFDAPDGSYFIRDRIILVPKNAVVPDGTSV